MLKEEISEIDKLLKKCKFIRQRVTCYIEKREKSYDPEKIDKKDSLALIIGTICDQQIKAEIAWQIPYHLSKWLKSEGKAFKASDIKSIGKLKLRTWLSEHMKDKWPSKLSAEKREEWLDKISSYIIAACEKIEKEYSDDPDNVFKVNDGKLSIPLIYFLLRQFPGIGPKKASMIARDFARGCEWLISIKERMWRKGIKIEIKSQHFSEVPIDVHVKRVLKRLGFSRYNEPQDFQNLARLIFPENPGLVDDFIWNLGREICRNPPKCSGCPLKEICDYRRRNYEPYRKGSC